MITFKQFVDKYNGKKLDWDNAYQGQCVDLFRFYIDEVIGVKQPRGVVGAADFWANYSTDPILKDNFTQIKNTPEFVPQESDVMIWNKRAGGGFGHIGVVISGNINEFTSFDQNWRSINVCEPTKHNYTNVYGVLRPKLPSIQNPMTEDLNKVLDHYHVKTADELISMVDTQLAFLDADRKKNKELEDKITSLQDDLKTATDISNDRKKVLEEIAYVLGIEVTVETAKREVEKIVARESGYIQQVAKLEKVVEEKDREIEVQRIKHLDDLSRLEDKLLQMEKKHALEIENLKRQLANVQGQVSDTNEQVAQNNVFKKFVDKFIKFWKNL